MDDTPLEAAGGSSMRQTGHSATPATLKKDDMEEEVTGRIEIQVPRRILRVITVSHPRM